MYSCREKGVAIGYDQPELILDNTTEIQQWRNPFGSFYLEGNFENRTVTSYESLSANQKWFHSNGNEMTIPMVAGMIFSSSF
jgi:hypothetical protein